MPARKGVRFPEASAELNKSLAAVMKAFGETVADVSRAADTRTDDPEAIRFLVWTERHSYATTATGSWFAIPNVFSEGHEDLRVEA